MNDELPPALKRDANNVAPFMLRAARAKALDELIAADAELLEASPPAPLPKCMDSPEGDIDFGLMKLNREASPPASPPNWVPPWVSKS